MLDRDLDVFIKFEFAFEQFEYDLVNDGRSLEDDRLAVLVVHWLACLLLVVPDVEEI